MRLEEKEKERRALSEAYEATCASFAWNEQKQRELAAREKKAPPGICLRCAGVLGGGAGVYCTMVLVVRGFNFMGVVGVLTTLRWWHHGSEKLRKAKAAFFNS